MSRVIFLPGEQLDDFVIEAPIGSGGMGDVYRARQLSRDRTVALKVIEAPAAESTEAARFRRAAAAAARLDHPNVVATYAVRETPDFYYVAMEFIDGTSFQDAVPRLAAAPINVPVLVPAVGPAAPAARVLARTDRPAAGATDGPDLPLLDLAVAGPGRAPVAAAGTSTVEMSTRVAPGGVGPGPDLTMTAFVMLGGRSYQHACCAWVRDAARGVEYAHQQGVTHRDIKPGNLMLGRDGRVRVIDFGLARGADDATITSTGQLLGSPLYMSPEQVTGRIALTPKTDIYSLGLVLYELLTLGPPVVAGNREELFLKIVAKPLEPIAQVNPGVGKAIEAVVHKATAKDPDDRYGTAAALADDLDRVIAGHPVKAAEYDPDDGPAEVLNARPTVVPVVAAQLYLGVFAWVGYGAFLMTFKDAPGRHRVSFPLLGLGWYGGAIAYAVAALLGAAAVGMSRGYRWGFGAGVGGQAALMLTAFGFVVTTNGLREFD